MLVLFSPAAVLDPLVVLVAPVMLVAWLLLPAGMFLDAVRNGRDRGAYGLAALAFLPVGAAVFGFVYCERYDLGLWPEPPDPDEVGV